MKRIVCILSILLCMNLFPSLATDAVTDREAYDDLYIESIPDVRQFYTPYMVHKQLEGTVLVQVGVDNKGNIFSVEVIRSSGHYILDRAAFEMAYQIQFRHFVGKEKTRYYAVPIVFKLK